MFPRLTGGSGRQRPRGLLTTVLVSLTLFGPLTALAQGEKTIDLVKAWEADAAKKAAAINAGKKASFFCANCHGEDGNSRYPEVPNLAGQNSAYLVEQIRKFGSGERKDDFMQGLIKVLNDEQKAQIALFYADAKVSPIKAGAVGDINRGKALFSRVCTGCHGPEAKGNETIPRLAGQQGEYLKKSLLRYRNKSGERLYAPMSAVTAQLNDNDVEAVVAFLSALKY
ncbi:putative cytochrome c4 [Oryzomicrobium terrae]|uniref:Putative cytochrome c4 n=1 Tax=Oryzomicrobium terrae TaxID=1735038 RepID=A0A5C1EDM4_9RHOO|nr:c-type cytochrome [Oryzomicrobium terrae]QEL66408.1 putative cytochrome c4 [Oryzomicrobium terrae]